MKKTNILALIFFFIALVGCEALKPKKVDTRNTPINAQAAARKNVEEGKGVSINNLFKKNNGTNFEFSSSNPLWRASLNVLDFMPLSTVDYSGGIIITDWYKSSNDKDSIKITIRFLSNEIKTNSLKIILHKKNCSVNSDCAITEIKSNISNELLASILKQASELEANKKK